MESWDSKISFLNLSLNSAILNGYMVNFGYIIFSRTSCKVDNFWGFFLVSFPKKLILRSANITTLDGEHVLVVTEGEDTIDHSEIIYAVINAVVYVCVLLMKIYPR